MTARDETDTDTADAPVVASAMSAKQTLMAEVDANGYVCGVRLLDPVVRSWDSATFSERACQVAGVAHDRYDAARLYADDSASKESALAAAADTERRLTF